MDWERKSVGFLCNNAEVKENVGGGGREEQGWEWTEERLGNATRGGKGSEGRKCKGGRKEL